jgi:uncharacterized protein involved in exopolysaccharide biosynthesis
VNRGQSAPYGVEDEIDLVGLWWIVWDHRILVAVTTVVCTLVALAIALTATPLYRASVTVTETPDTGLGKEGGMAEQLGGLAGLALASGGQHPERQAVLRSRHLVEEFVTRPDVLPLLSAHDKKEHHSVWLTVELFRKNALDIQEDKLKGTTTVTIDWTDPEVARRWADEFVGLANAMLREKAIDDATRNVAYLQAQVDRTTSVEIQEVMYRLVEQETRTLMLAKGRTEYAFTVVDPAVKAEVRVSPKRTLLVLSGIAVGLFLGSFVVWVRAHFSRRRRPPMPAGDAEQ